MVLAELTADGQITVPAEVRRQLGLKTGDKILFCQNMDGETVLSNASATAILEAQRAFAGLAEKLGVKDENEVQALVDEVRYAKP